MAHVRARQARASNQRTCIHCGDQFTPPAQATPAMKSACPPCHDELVHGIIPPLGGCVIGGNIYHGGEHLVERGWWENAVHVVEDQCLGH